MEKQNRKSYQSLTILQVALARDLVAEGACPAKLALLLGVSYSSLKRRMNAMTAANAAEEARASS